MEKDALEVKRQLAVQTQAAEAAYRAKDTIARHLDRVQAEAVHAQDLLKKVERQTLSRAKDGQILTSTAKGKSPFQGVGLLGLVQTIGKFEGMFHRYFFLSFFFFIIYFSWRFSVSDSPSARG